MWDTYSLIIYPNTGGSQLVAWWSNHANNFCRSKNFSGFSCSCFLTPVFLHSGYWLRIPLRFLVPYRSLTLEPSRNDRVLEFTLVSGFDHPFLFYVLRFSDGYKCKLRRTLRYLDSLDETGRPRHPRKWGEFLVFTIIVKGGERLLIHKDIKFVLVEHARKMGWANIEWK